MTNEAEEIQRLRDDLFTAAREPKVDAFNCGRNKHERSRSARQAVYRNGRLAVGQDQHSTVIAPT
jgi:hypothetical protein